MEDLKAVNRSVTPWVIVGGHRPFYIDSTNYDPVQGDQTVAADLRAALEQEFVKYEVRCSCRTGWRLCSTCGDQAYQCAEPGRASTRPAGPLSHVTASASVASQRVRGLLPANWQVDMTWHGHHHSYQRTCPVDAQRCHDRNGSLLP